MRRSLRHRAVSLWLAAVFPLLSGGTLLAGHGCPHHDGSRSPAGSPGHVAATPMDAGAAQHTAVGHDGSHDHSDDHPNFCTCIGDCNAGATVLHPAASATVRAAPAVREIVERPPHEERVRVRTPYLLPFANAPPSV